MNKDSKRMVLGIDPGTNYMGYGIVCCQNNKNILVLMDVLKNTHTGDAITKLKLIFRRTSELITEYNITEVAIEDPFFGKNVQSMLKLGRAQGMAMAAALNLDIPVHQYAARKIKQSITGNGNASKEQVAAMLQRLLDIQDMPDRLDATDALSVAVCHLNQNTALIGDGKLNSWKAFIAKNPGRVG